MNNNYLKYLLLWLTVFSSASYAGFFSELFGISKVPDFAEIKDISKRKQAFFQYLTPAIQKENQRILSLRQKIKESNNTQWLEKLATKYNTKDAKDIKAALLKRVDIIPSALALAQAANESSWGKSRFARYYYNFFGTWCFKAGCGVKPKKRPAGMTYEVAAFDSFEQGLKYYMKILNSHVSYQKLRDIRFQLRQQNKTIDGLSLATGLEKYATTGKKYVEDLSAIIRVNKLFSVANH